MFSLRPAFPRGIYVFGAVATALLLTMAAVRPGSVAVQVEARAVSASSPQLLAMDLVQ